MTKDEFRQSCLPPAAVQTVLAVLFAAYSLIPKSAGLPENARLMPFFLFPTLAVFIWNMTVWLKTYIRSRGRDHGYFWIALLIIAADIAAMGYLMPHGKAE